MVSPALRHAHANLLVSRASALASVACIWLGAVATARAATEQEPIRLEYQADAGCPSVLEFERMVFKRTHSARPAAEQEPARVFSVTLRQSGTQINGSLTVREGDQTLVRNVSGHACAELASVLALATALAIDPSAEILPEAATDEQSTSDASSKDALGTGSTALPAGAEADPFDPPDALPMEPSSRVFRLGLGPKAEWAATPYAAVGPSLSLEMHSSPPSWTLGVAVNGLFTPSKVVSGARANFSLLTVSAHACALGLHWQNVVQAGPCVALDVGQINASAENLPETRSSRRIWSTLGVHLAVLTQLSERWSLHLDVGPNFLLTQYSFQIDDPSTNIFEQGNWTGSARLTLGYQL